MWHDDQPIDLFVAVVGERKYGPIAVAFASAHFNAPNDSIRPGCSRDLDAIAVSFLDFGGGGEIDSGGIETHVDRIHRVGGGNCKQRNSKCCHQRCQATRHDRAKSPSSGCLTCSAADASLAVEACKQSHPVKRLRPTLCRFRGSWKNRPSVKVLARFCRYVRWFPSGREPKTRLSGERSC